MKASPESIKNTAVNTVFYAREDNSSVYSTKIRPVLRQNAYILYIIYYILQFYYYYNFISFFFPTGAVRL
jgi:hypothetical protein